MTSLNEFTQADFTQAMLDPAAAVPLGLVNPDGAPATKRFNVYRNNVAVSLTDALETAFPVLVKLLGEQNFKGLAGLYLRQHPPSTPLLMFYGEEMPRFLAGLPQLAHLPYLADVARLELALRESYHAADSSGIDASILQTMPPDRLMAARLRFAPSVRLLRSRYPIHGIWQFNMVQGAPQPEPKGQNVLITRPEFDPVMQPLPAGGGTFVARAMDGASFAKALDAAQSQVPEFDLTATLGLLLAGNAVTQIA